MKCGLSAAFADTLEGVSTWSSTGLVDFPGLQRWNALLSEPQKRCQHYFDSFPVTASGDDKDVVRRLRSATRQRARAVVRSRTGPIAHYLSPIATMFALAKTVTVWAAVWDEALG